VTVDQIKEAAEHQGVGKSTPRQGRHAVDQPMVDHWLDAIGDRTRSTSTSSARPPAVGIVAPQAAETVWTMAGLHRPQGSDDPLGKILGMFDDAGYIGVAELAGGTTAIYDPATRSASPPELTDVVGPKNTALGEAALHHPEDHLVHQRRNRRRHDAAHHEVQAGEQASASSVPADLDSRINDAPGGVPRHPVLLGRCRHRTSRESADGTLQHQPVPAIWQGGRRHQSSCVVAQGAGTVFSLVMHHAPAGAGERASAIRDRVGRTG